MGYIEEGIVGGCNGKQQSIEQPCEVSNSPSACYNSYQDSEHIGYSAHFSCPDACVPILDMCQGMSWCPEDVEVCDENLRIPRAITTKLLPYPPIQVEELSISHVTSHHYLDPASEASGVLPNLYYLQPGAHKSATKTTTFERRA